jgi:oxazoline/thiazoline synthase
MPPERAVPGPRPVFKPAFHVEVVNPDGVFLLSERSHFLLEGALYCRLAPLLDGDHTVDDIVDALADETPPAEVYYALGRLEKRGYVEHVDAAVSPERAAYWQALGLDVPVAERRLRETTVALVQFGAVPLEDFSAALTALNIRLGGDAALAVALTDDYLQEGLCDFNAAALRSGRPWLLVKPVGTLLWIGPVFRPGRTACWECLAQRLRGNREVESYLQYRKGITTPFPTSRAALSASVQAALGLAALETARALAQGEQPGLAAVLTTLDTTTLETQKHTVVRRPQCPRCGPPGYTPNRDPVPMIPQSRLKAFTADGGHRVVSPQRTFAQYEHHISPFTGAVGLLTRIPVDEDGLLHVYVAEHGADTVHDNLKNLRHGLRSHNAGKGVTDAQARVSALCEALERYSGTFQGDEIRRQASYRRLGAGAIHPNACMLFSDRQYARRDEWNARAIIYQHVPEPFDEDAEIEWTPVWSLTAREFKYLPTAYCYFNYPPWPGWEYGWADSNGSAAGNVLEEALVQGFLELVERDSVAVWWYNRLRRPAVDLDSFDEPYIQELRRQHRKLHREVWVLDLTGDLGVPTFAAVSRRVDRAEENILFGFGAHFDARVGVLRALTELSQDLMETRGLDPSGEGGGFEPECLPWWTTATCANQPYLVPTDAPPRGRTDYQSAPSDDLRDDVVRCQALVEQQGMELLVLDQTRPDIGLSVVKVIVPGLRHFWPRFAPGRLYDVPVKLGWLPAPLAEEQLNPFPLLA